MFLKFYHKVLNYWFIAFKVFTNISNCLLINFFVLINFIVCKTAQAESDWDKIYETYLGSENKINTHVTTYPISSYYYDNANLLLSEAEKSNVDCKKHWYISGSKPFYNHHTGDRSTWFIPEFGISNHYPRVTAALYPIDKPSIVYYFNNRPLFPYYGTTTRTEQLINSFSSAKLDDIFNKLNITNSSNWVFERGLWIVLPQFFNNSSSIFFAIWTEGYLFLSFITFFFVFFSYKLFFAKTVQQAISSFFVCILSTGIFLIYTGAEYIASITVIVYAGAVIIFFVFILFTTDPKWFYNEEDVFDNVKLSNKTVSFNIREIKIYAHNMQVLNQIVFLVSLGALLYFFFYDTTYSFYKLNSITITSLWWTFFVYDVKNYSNPIFSFGNLLFSDYWLATSILAGLLLFVLVFSISILSFSKNKKKSSFYWSYITYKKFIKVF